MSHDNPEIIKRHVKIYLGIFLALLVLTGMTVGVTHIHMSFWTAVIVALIIAGVKGSLVAGFFMHLIGEKKVIFWVILSAVVFLPFLLFLPILNEQGKSGTTIAPPSKKVDVHALEEKAAAEHGGHAEGHEGAAEAAH